MSKGALGLSQIVSVHRTSFVLKLSQLLINICEGKSMLIPVVFAFVFGSHFLYFIESVVAGVPYKHNLGHVIYLVDCLKTDFNGFKAGAS